MPESRGRRLRLPAELPGGQRFGFVDGKGLESALRTKLEEVEQEVQAIESGKASPLPDVSATAGDSDGRAYGRGASDIGGVDGAPPADGVSDDDIPF